MTERRRMARPERFELPTFWFVGIRPENPNACSGVAYGPETLSKPSSIVRSLSVVRNLQTGDVG